MKDLHTNIYFVQNSGFYKGRYYIAIAWIKILLCSYFYISNYFTFILAVGAPIHKLGKTKPTFLKRKKSPVKQHNFVFSLNMLKTR